MIEQSNDEVRAEVLSRIKKAIYIAGDTNDGTQYDVGWNAALNEIEKTVDKLITDKIKNIISDQYS